MTATSWLDAPSSTRCELIVDLTAVAANTRLFAALTAGELMGVVKADGFGHGALDVARTVLDNGATRLGVTSVQDALRLRAGGVVAPILSWLNPVQAPWAAAVGADVELAVSDVEHLNAIVAQAPGARVHLQLDCGMVREGCPSEDWPALCVAARRAEAIERIRVVGIMGHQACADVPRHPANARGRARFEWGVREAFAAGLTPVHRHLAATAATLTDPLSHYTMSRVGAGLFGIDPSGTTKLHSALTLTAPLVQVRQIRAGTPVGYGHTWTASQATRLGVVPLGYADGLPRAASNRALVLVDGRRRPLVGRISMDMTVVDLGPAHDGAGTAAMTRLGDTVTVFGPGDSGEPTVAEWAGWADTIEHEIITGLGRRVERTTRPDPGPRSVR